MLSIVNEIDPYLLLPLCVLYEIQNQIYQHDADWASNTNDRKSTTGGCYYVGNNLVAWMSKKKKNLYLCQLQKQNILLLEVVVHSFFG